MPFGSCQDAVQWEWPVWGDGRCSRLALHSLLECGKRESIRFSGMNLRLE